MQNGASAIFTKWAISVTFLIWWLSMQGLQAALEETSYKNSSYYDILGGITNIG